MNKRAYAIGFVIVAVLAVGMFRAKEGARDSAEQIATLKGEIMSLDAQIELLETEYAHVSRRETIASLASEQLGMGPFRAEQLLRVDDLAQKMSDPAYLEASLEASER